MDAASLPGSAGSAGEVVAASQDQIDVLAYWRIVVKRRWLILAVLASVLLLTLLWTLTAVPIYRATSVLQINNEEQNVVQSAGSNAAGQASWDPQFLHTQYELLKSRALAERVADDLNLDRAAAAAMSSPSWLQRVRSVLRPAREQGSASGQDAAADRRAMAEVIRQGLTVEPVRNSRLVRLNFDSPVPAFSAQVSNAIAEGFIASGLERRFGASSYAKAFLEDQLKLVKSRLERSERQLVTFAQEENLVTTAEGQSLVGQNLSALNASLATAQEQRIRALARWNEVRAGGDASLPADMLQNSIIGSLKQQRAQLQGQYQQKLQVFKPEYPEMLQLTGQIGDINRQIVAELSEVKSSVKAGYSAAIAQENLLMRQLDALRAQTLEVDGRSIQYTILKREVDTNRQLYDGLLQRYKEVGVAGDVRLNNIAVIDSAEVPARRFKPSVLRNVAFGLLAGLLLGVLVAFVLDYLDDTLKTPQDVESRLKLSVLGIIPRLGKLTAAEAAGDPRSAFSEAYRSVRTALQFSTSHGVPGILLITSPGPGEGKSTSSVNLARNLAQLGKRVLLIDADLRNPSLHKYLELTQSAGLSNLLAGAATAADVVRETQFERVSAILAGPLPPNPAELLSGSMFSSLVHTAAENYDQIIIDAPPVMGLADAPILATTAAATLLVIQSGKTSIASAQAAVKRLAAVRGHVIGTLITHYDSRAAGYGHLDYEGYYAYGNSPHPAEK